jgi:MoxR-like ATPase
VLENVDRRDGQVYVFASDDDPLQLAAEVAIITDRPLLLRGDPGVGKSSLAAFIARQRGWRYYEHTVTARTEATDLLWTFDAVRKLGDATLLVHGGPKATLNDHNYVKPGELWWAFDPASAARRGAGKPVADPPDEPLEELNANRSEDGAVVLVDEIDKADPDVPNALLLPLGSRQFEVAETSTLVRQTRPRVLVLITTNEERILPPAFVRRCVVYVVPSPDAEHMARIAAKHAALRGRSLGPGELALVDEIAETTQKLQGTARSLHLRPPGVAEFLDAVWAALDLGITTADTRWEYIKGLTLAKDEGLL